MRRAGWITVMLIGAAAVVAPMVGPMPTRLLWNASASVPVGLYVVRPVHRLATGMLVAAMPPDLLAEFLAGRGYLARGVPLLKHVVALPGARICRRGAVVSIDGRDVAVAQSRDRHGRPLPVWSGCHAVGPNELFLLNPGVPDSLDGRYFGALPRRSIVGEARPLWTRSTLMSRNPPASERTIP